MNEEKTVQEYSHIPDDEVKFFTQLFMEVRDGQKTIEQALDAINARIIEVAEEEIPAGEVCCDHD